MNEYAGPPIAFLGRRNEPASKRKAIAGSDFHVFVGKPQVPGVPEEGFENETKISRRLTVPNHLQRDGLAGGIVGDEALVKLTTVLEQLPIYGSDDVTRSKANLPSRFPRSEYSYPGGFFRGSRSSQERKAGHGSIGFDGLTKEVTSGNTTLPGKVGERHAIHEVRTGTKQDNDQNGNTSPYPSASATHQESSFPGIIATGRRGRKAVGL
jgi:hypothetical protein